MYSVTLTDRPFEELKTNQKKQTKEITSTLISTLPPEEQSLNTVGKREKPVSREIPSPIFIYHALEITRTELLTVVCC